MFGWPWPLIGSVWFPLRAVLVADGGNLGADHERSRRLNEQLVHLAFHDVGICPHLVNVGKERVGQTNGGWPLTVPNA